MVIAILTQICMAVWYDQVRCLNALTNVVIVWNTVYLQAPWRHYGTKAIQFGTKIWCNYRLTALRISIATGTTSLMSKPLVGVRGSALWSQQIPFHDAAYRKYLRQILRPVELQ